MTARGITIASASAGSGKTYRLTQEVTTAVDPNADPRVPLEGLVAVTYTTKAHAELAARIRHKLVQTGAYDEAARLPLAYLGTVHAACLRLLQEFALDAGLSPTVDVVADDQAKLLRQALEASLPPEHKQRLDALAKRWQLHYRAEIKRFDWTRPVADIMDLARSNRIAPSALPAMAQRSIETFLSLLPKPENDGEALDAELAKELARASQRLDKRDDDTQATRNARETLRAGARHLADGELTWSEWTKLATLATGASSRDAVIDLREVAARYERHPRLHAEARDLITAIYEAARVGLSGYQTWKQERRVVDYVDMLDGALDLLANPRVQRELASRLRLVVVDEFQDTSPIQLALFMKLHGLTGRSVWVGDRKQCIFEYAGADPQLMDAVAGWVAANGGKPDPLKTNYRSRPELVKACSELFAAALERHGFVRDEVVVGAHRDAKKELALEALPPFGLWLLGGTKRETDAEAIAEGVRRMLADAKSTPVVDRVTGEVRDVRPGDVAVLVATNAEAKLIAGALHARGIRSALARAGLLETPEGMLADAALRWLIDEEDSLAAAVIDALTGAVGDDPDAWLEARLRAAREEEARKGKKGEAAESAGPMGPAWSAPLARVREMLGLLSPTEALDEALAALDAVQLCARWPDPAQRIANLDALRALAAAYEDRCAQEHEAATIGGLLRHFDDLATERFVRDEKLASDDQHVPTDDGAVTVSTYHRSKGLEWPVVVLASLERGDKRWVFDSVCPESEREGFDPEDPLAGRWIRYWPWPFGQTWKTPLNDAGEASSWGRGVAAREDKERARLLYVGFTRARDHLVLAVRQEKGKLKAAWLDSLANRAGEPLLELPTDAADGASVEVAIRAGQRASVRARVWRVGPERTQEERSRTSPRWFAVPAPRSSEAWPPPYWISPSNAATDWPELAPQIAAASLGEAHRFGTAARLEQKGIDYANLGDAVHAFLAADQPGETQERRLAKARRLLAHADLLGTIRPEALLDASDALRSFVDGRWPGARWRHEIPIEARIGERSVAGIIDLFVDTQKGAVVIDHKTFPAPSEAAWRNKCSEFVPQLVAYDESLARAGVTPVENSIHLPLGGGALDVRVSPRSRQQD